MSTFEYSPCFNIKESKPPGATLLAKVFIPKPSKGKRYLSSNLKSLSNLPMKLSAMYPFISAPDISNKLPPFLTIQKLVKTITSLHAPSSKTRSYPPLVNFPPVKTLAPPLSLAIKVPKYGVISMRKKPSPKEYTVLLKSETSAIHKSHPSTCLRKKTPEIIYPLKSILPPHPVTNTT